MINLFNLFKTKKTVSINLAENVQLVVVPVTGGVNATLIEDTGMFRRQEKAYFASVDDLTRSLNLTNESIIRKLSKAF